MTAQHGVFLFRDDDEGYLSWLAANPDGYVINILNSGNPAGARAHRASCSAINGQNPRGGKWTWPYVKVCAELQVDLDRWEATHGRGPISSCKRCDKASGVTQPRSTRRTRPTVDAVGPQEVRRDIAGPAPDSEAVHAWADDYIRYERRPVWQEHLREEIRQRCRKLEPTPEQVLHAMYFGAKHPRADVENLVLYNIDTFEVPGRNGIRFEHGGAIPPGPDDADYQFCYSYALSPRSGAFAHWRQERTLVSFDWIELETFAGDKKLAQVWLALALSRKELKGVERIAPEAPFGVRLQVRPPHTHKPVWGGLVKGIFDGVICAFQAHTDNSLPPEVLDRLAKGLPAQPEEIERLLRDQRCAALGGVPRLVSPYRSGVKWDPSDHLCVAGELLAADAKPGDDRWAIKGEIFELAGGSDPFGGGSIGSTVNPLPPGSPLTGGAGTAPNTLQGSAIRQ